MNEQIRSEVQEQQNEPKEMSMEGLASALREAGIDTTLYGQGKAKTLDHLLREINKGEMQLTKDEDGKLQREVMVGKADVIYVTPEGRKLRLTEDRQVFKDGRMRRRDLGEAVSEKLKPEEDIKGAMMRGIKEELNIEGEIDIEEISEDIETVESPSYPGLSTKYNLYRHSAVLNNEQYKSEGYVEKQADKSTYFVWEEVEDKA